MSNPNPEGNYRWYWETQSNKIVTSEWMLCNCLQINDANICNRQLFNTDITKRKSEVSNWKSIPVNYTKKTSFLTLSWRRPLSYRNESTDLQCKSVDWFLYDNSLRHEKVNIIYLIQSTIHRCSMVKRNKKTFHQF